jgi:hypothetical protein
MWLITVTALHTNTSNRGQTIHNTISRKHNTTENTNDDTNIIDVYYYEGIRTILTIKTKRCINFSNLFLE